jgi:gas vesicle protein
MNKSGFWFGLGAGIGLGLLFAPRAGNKTRTLVRDKAMDGVAKAKDGVAYVKRRADEAKEEAAEVLKDAAGRVIREGEGLKAAVMAGKHAYEKVVSS